MRLPHIVYRAHFGIVPIRVTLRLVLWTHLRLTPVLFMALTCPHVMPLLLCRARILRPSAMIVVVAVLRTFTRVAVVPMLSASRSSK